MRQKTIEKVNRLFLNTLPKKLKDVLDGYEQFILQNTPSDVKSFGAYHSACKNALSHILLLMKMLQLAELQNQSETSVDWLDKAKRALAETEDENDNI